MAICEATKKNMLELKNYINGLVTIPSDKVDYIVSKFYKKSISKESFFININENCDYIGFLVKGIIRFYYLTNDNQETTCYLSFPNEFVTSKYSFFSKKPSKEALKAIVDSELYVIHRKDFEELQKEIPELYEITNRIYDNFSNILLKRIALLQINSAEERYHYLLKHKPHLLQSVPLQYLASYLGVTPQHLSRLRKAKSTNGKLIYP